MFIRFFICFIVIYKGNAEDACQELSRSGMYDYQNLLPIDDVSLKHTTLERDNDSLTHFEMRIGIKAAKDGIIVLSPRSKVSSKLQKDKLKIFEIVVGAGKNTWTGLRLSANGNTEKYRDTPNILNASHFTEFHIKILNGRLEFGFANGSSPILDFNDSDLYSVKYLGFSAWDAQDNTTFRYDCPFMKEDSESGSLYICIISSVCGIAILVTMSVVTILFLRKRRQPLQKSEADLIYDDIIGKEESTPVPILLPEVYATFNDAHASHTYSEPYVPASVDELYTKPIPKKFRGPIKPVIYAELQLNKGHEVPDYATLEDLDRATRTRVAATRTQVAATRTRDDNYVQVLPQPFGYSGGSETNRDYANCDSAKYVNGCLEEYAEPAYCEINVKKN